MLRLASLVLVLSFSWPAWAVTMSWTSVGNPGNACDPQPGSGLSGCFGSVGYTYSISKHEVTNAQYAEFLNAKATSDPYGLYDPLMASAVASNFGGILRSESSGSYTYSVIPGRENKPVNFISWYDAVRFANWLNNGQGSADTETGAYRLLGGTANPSNGTTVTRNAVATIVLPSEDEWYKAAYYNASTTSYSIYPTNSSALPVCALPTATPNRANCDRAFMDGDFTDVGSYTGSSSFYGTFDQGGNVEEWNEAIVFLSPRIYRGGSSTSSASLLGSDWRKFRSADNDPGLDRNGFRLVLLPEPSTGLLVIAGLLGLAGWRRA
jgi:formylglycine-generating enzyme required for sulfatase activity